MVKSILQSNDIASFLQQKHHILLISSELNFNIF